MEKLLEAQADRIEQILGNFGVHVQVYGGQVLPHILVYDLQLAKSQRLRRLMELHRDLARLLGIGSVIIEVQKDGTITVTVPRPDPEIVTLESLLPQLPAMPHTAVLGMAGLGEPLLLHFPSPDVAHVLIAGMTGSGKSELIKTMVVSLDHWGQRRDTCIYLVDPKRRKVAALAGLPTVEAYCRVDEVPALLEHLLALMERRVEEVLPRVFLIIDELADVVMVGGREVEAGLIRLVGRARESGIHVIAATQRPSADVVQGLMRANFPVRISGAVNSAGEAAIALGIPGSGAERLLGRGDMIVVHRGQDTRFLAAMVGDGQMPTAKVDKPLHLGERLEVLAERLTARLALRGPGRPKKAMSAALMEFIEGELLNAGGCSQRAVRAWHIQEFDTDINPKRVKAAIEASKRRLVKRGIDLG